MAVPASPRQRQAGITAAAADQGQWWLSQPADQYAIQLIAIDARAVNRYVQQHDLDASVNSFPVKRPDGDLVALAVGPIAGKAAAEAEALRWQQRLPGIQPWVRSVASIQRTVRSAEAPSPAEWLARVRANEQLLLQASPRDYAVQLLAMDREGVTAFVDKHGLTGKVVYFRTRVNGRERYAALMGGYADREQALAAGHQIAAEAGIHPWVRSLASVQDVIRNYELQTR
jgi:septal ring-binding cell division protein DamX